MSVVVVGLVWTVMDCRSCRVVVFLVLLSYSDDVCIIYVAVGLIDLGGLLVCFSLLLISCSDSVHYFVDLSPVDGLSLHNVLR